MKNITFSADERTIEDAREYARAQGTTLNECFRAWLDEFARQQRTERGMAVLRDLQSRYTTGGRKFTRDEMNER